MNNRELNAELAKTAHKQSDDVLKSAKEIFKDFPGTVFTSYKTGNAAADKFVHHIKTSVLILK